MQEVKIPYERGPTLSQTYKGSQAVILDFQVASDYFPLKLPHVVKVNKYNPIAILNWVKELTGMTTIANSSVTLSWGREDGSGAIALET